MNKEIIKNIDDIKNIKSNKIITQDNCDLELINSSIEFTGKNNILYINSKEKVIIKDTIIKFLGDNSIVFLNKNIHKYLLNIDIYNNSIFYIGKNCYINKPLNAIISEEKNIIIGNNCLFSLDVWLRTADPHLIYDIKTHKRINKSKDIIIGDHVWIGQKATLLKGATIGSGSIIGAAGVVSKKVLSNEVVGGNPCKTIKKDIFWTKECVHRYKKQETEKSMVYTGNNFIYKGNFDSKIVDKKINSKNTEEKLEYIVNELVNHRKNYFAISKKTTKIKTRKLIKKLLKIIKNKK